MVTHDGQGWLAEWIKGMVQLHPSPPHQQFAVRNWSKDEWNWSNGGCQLVRMLPACGDQPEQFRPATDDSWLWRCWITLCWLAVRKRAVDGFSELSVNSGREAASHYGRAGKRLERGTNFTKQE